jgi:hypothetical protein
MVALVILTAQPSEAQVETEQEQGIRGYEFRGAYAQIGGTVGAFDGDEVAGGFTATGGYRFLPWVSAEGNVTFLRGDDKEIVGFIAGAKFYPLGAVEAPAVPDFVQPYGAIGLGVGTDDRSYLARFMLGVDVWATDQLGFFVEGGGYAVGGHSANGIGNFSLGAQFRF